MSPKLADEQRMLSSLRQLQRGSRVVRTHHQRHGAQLAAEHLRVCGQDARRGQQDRISASEWAQDELSLRRVALQRRIGGCGSLNRTIALLHWPRLRHFGLLYPGCVLAVNG